MTVQTPHQNGAQNGVRTYRGRKLEELIPQIRAELGPDAIIVREREGMMGGVNGFFARRCVEVDVKPGGPKVDLYDEEPEALEDHDLASEEADVPDEHSDIPAPVMPDDDADVMVALDELASSPPSFVEPKPYSASSFAAQLNVAKAEPPALPQPKPVAAEPVEASPELVAVEPEPVAAPEPEPVAVEPEPVAAPEPEPVAVQPAPARLATAPPRPPEAEARPVINELVAQGMTERWALELTGAAAAHANPFTPAGSLRDAVRATLAASLPAAAPLPAAGAAIAFVGAGGAGKTRISAALASAYGRSSTLSVSVVSLDTTKDAKQLTQLLKGREIEVIVAGDAAGASEMIAGGRAGGLVIIDTGGVTPADEAAVRTLERELESLDLDAAYVAVPATLSMHAAKKLIETLERLQPSGIVVTHADESDHLGVAAELSCLTGIPVAYIHEGLDLDNAVSAPDPAALAARLLP
jgi:flagellar biosynthesis GTPase FlhF